MQGTRYGLSSGGTTESKRHALGLSPGRHAWASVQSVALVGTYVPRRCGIATFTSDLAEAISGVEPNMHVQAVAMNDRPEGYRYPPRVWFEINQNRLGEYRLAADFLNLSAVDVCCIQHEYGIFGGPDGAAILDFISRLRMPAVATLHTVLREPSQGQRETLIELSKRCDRLVVMAERAFEFLTEIYGVSPEKIALIPHGIPDVPFVDPNFYKDQFGVEGKKVILTFGLIGPSKGLEHMIEALPRIVEQHPDVVYMIVGATHPGVLAHSGEDYRLGLKQRARELGVDQHIEWFNKFVELEELVEFLGSADVYVTPYQNEAQITSGTLAYALGTGKATVSTPYWYAQEMLADDRGKLVPFDNTEALSDSIIELLSQETLRHATRKRAYTYTRQMRWQDVGQQYLDLFAQVREDRNRHPRPNAAIAGKSTQRRAELPEVKLDQIRRLTDDTGLLRAARATIPHRAEGYTTDDNARALIVTLKAQDHQRLESAQTMVALASGYMSFLDDAFLPETGRFRNQLGYDRQWKDHIGSEDAHGRSIWALGEAVARADDRGMMLHAASLFHQALPACETLQFHHGMAFSLIGIHAYLRRFSGDSHARRVRETLAHRLYEDFSRQEDPDWPWPLNELTYASAVLPHALLMSGRWMFHDGMIQAALRSLDWLAQVQSAPRGYFAPVGTEGWMPRSAAKARFNQLPLEAAVMLDASLEAYRVTEDKHWLERAERCVNWFLGDNDLRLPLYDPATGGCHDALMPQGVSENQSAEATLAWLLSLLAMYDHQEGLKSSDTPTSQPQPRKTTPDHTMPTTHAAPNQGKPDGVNTSPEIVVQAQPWQKEPSS